MHDERICAIRKDAFSNAFRNAFETFKIYTFIDA